MKFNISTILSDENIAQAVDFLKTKKNACGDDGIWLHDLEDYWKQNANVLRASIINEIYEPQLVHEKVILMPNGKHRKISLFSSVDRMLSRAILQVIQIPMEQGFSKYSFAYQQGKGIDSAVVCSAEYIKTGKEYVVEIDIKDFFDNISHMCLLSKMECMIEDPILYNLLVKYITCRVESGCCIQKKTCGLLQGSSLSPLLSNLYLTELDGWMEKQGYAFVRFADNINIYVSSLQEGYQVLEEVVPQLRRYHLEINKKKAGIFSVYSKKYLGYVFEKSGENILVKRYNPKKKRIFSSWHKESVEHVGNDYYIVNNGILTKKDFTILFANEEQKTYIPVETSDTINIYSNVEISLNFLEMLHDNQLNLNIFNQYGRYIGSFYTANQKNRMKCLIEQVGVYQDTKKRLCYAKKIDMAAIHNLRCNLRYYMKHYPSDTLQEAITELSNGISMINQSDCIENILLAEARCRQKYYGCFNEMITNNEFCFTVRSRRPPKDEINALISFGNVYLYQKIAQIIRRTSLDIRISFVHSAMQRYENLNLDIADIFKPIVVDRVICMLINKRMILKDRHFEKEDQGTTFLNNDGKQIFLQELENKMKQIVTVNAIKYTYERLIYQEVKNLENSFLKGQKYKPFKYQL